MIGAHDEPIVELSMDWQVTIEYLQHTTQDIS